MWYDRRHAIQPDGAARYDHGVVHLVCVSAVGDGVCRTFGQRGNGRMLFAALVYVPVRFLLEGLFRRRLSRARWLVWLGVCLFAAYGVMSLPALVTSQSARRAGASGQIVVTNEPANWGVEAGLRIALCLVIFLLPAFLPAVRRVPRREPT